MLRGGAEALPYITVVMEAKLNRKKCHGVPNWKIIIESFDKPRSVCYYFKSSDASSVVKAYCRTPLEQLPTALRLMFIHMTTVYIYHNTANMQRNNGMNGETQFIRTEKSFTLKMYDQKCPLTRQELTAQLLLRQSGVGIG